MWTHTLDLGTVGRSKRLEKVASSSAGAPGSFFGIDFLLPKLELRSVIQPYLNGLLLLMVLTAIGRGVLQTCDGLIVGSH